MDAGKVTVGLRMSFLGMALGVRGNFEEPEDGNGWGQSQVPCLIWKEGEL